MALTLASDETTQNDPDREGEEGCLRMLTELAERSRNMVRILRKSALLRAGGDPAAVPAETLRALERIAREARLTEALKRSIERRRAAEAAKAEAARLARRVRADGYAGLRPTIH